MRYICSGALDLSGHQIRTVFLVRCFMITHQFLIALGITEGALRVFPFSPGPVGQHNLRAKRTNAVYTNFLLFALHFHV